MRCKSHAEKILKAAAWCCPGLIIVLTSVIVAARIYTYRENHITSSNGVDEGIYVALGGQQQYLLIRGQDVGNPVIIRLHGGPAGPDSNTTYVFEQPLTDSYKFVNWDRRGCGRTYYRIAENDPDNLTVTFEQTQKDPDEPVDYLCRRFNRDKVVIVGHSYRTAVGSCYAIVHPEKVAAYIGADQVVSPSEGETRSYEDALQRAEKAGEDTSSMEQAYRDCLT